MWKKKTEFTVMEVLTHLKNAGVSPEALNLCSQLLEREGYLCTERYGCCDPTGTQLVHLSRYMAYNLLPRLRRGEFEATEKTPENELMTYISERVNKETLGRLLRCTRPSYIRNVLRKLT